jgi:hypothetical protein
MVSLGRPQLDTVSWRTGYELLKASGTREAPVSLAARDPRGRSLPFVFRRTPAQVTRPDFGLPDQPPLADIFPPDDRSLPMSPATFRFYNLLTTSIALLCKLPGAGLGTI